MAARPEQERGRPGRLARDGAAGRGHVDELEAGQVDRRRAHVGDLGELVRRRSAAGLDLRHEQRRDGPRDGGARHRTGWRAGGKHDPAEQRHDEQRGDGRETTLHDRPPGGEPPGAGRDGSPGCSSRRSLGDPHRITRRLSARSSPGNRAVAYDCGPAETAVPGDRRRNRGSRQADRTFGGAPPVPPGVDHG